MKFIGRRAVQVSIQTGVQLHMYNSGIEQGGPVSVEKACLVIDEDSSLIYCEVQDATDDEIMSLRADASASENDILVDMCDMVLVHRDSDALADVSIYLVSGRVDS